MPFNYHKSNPAIPPRYVDGTGFNKVALITGCASSVGLATTQLFLSHQYSVLGVDIQDMDYALIEERDQERFHFHRGDLLEEGQCDEVVRICVSEYGPRIDVLANAAGVRDDFTAADVFTDAEWAHVIGVNLTVPTQMIRAVLPLMKTKKDGCIVNVAIESSGESAAGVAYTASKHGLLGVTKNTALRLQADGIRCNAILPGVIASTDQKATTTVTEVANAILFLASDQARAINGISLPIDRAGSAI